MKRAGLDYWHAVTVRYYDDFAHFVREHVDKQHRFFFVETWGEKFYSDVAYQEGDFIILGKLVFRTCHKVGIQIQMSRAQGWWFRGGAKPNWSYSWAVAHSLYLLLQSGKAPMHAKQVSSASELQPGDVICYDFDGDGRWQHNTIVVDKDQNGMPLVIAHTFFES